MSRKTDKRERLIQSADQLILEQGFRQTTLSDIAEDSGVPLGNVYYYFKTKDAIGQSIIDSRLRSMKAWLDSLNEHATPKQRLLAFLDYPIMHRRELSAHGCPLGTLAYELSHSDNMLSSLSKELLEVVLDWSRDQFEAMQRPDSGELALQFVSNLQGMSLIANVMDDDSVVDRMVARTRDWIENL